MHPPGVDSSIIPSTPLPLPTRVRDTPTDLVSIIQRLGQIIRDRWQTVKLRGACSPRTSLYENCAKNKTD